MSGISVTTPPAVGSAQITDNSIVNADINSAAGIVGTKLASATVADANLASPNNSTYKTILFGTANLTTASASGTTYAFMPLTANSVLASTVGGVSTGWPLRSLVATEFAVAGLTTKLLVRASVTTNNTAPAQTITTGLYPMTVTTATWTPGAVISGSTVAVVTPGASATTTGTSGDFAFPADGAYALGVIVSAAPSGNLTVNASLSVRNV